MQPARELPHVLQRGGELRARLGHERRAGRGIVLQPPLGHGQREAERDQPLLRAVVQVALQAPALRVGRVHEACAGRPQLRGELAQLVLAPHLLQEADDLEADRRRGARPRRGPSAAGRRSTSSSTASTSPSADTAGKAMAVRSSERTSSSSDQACPATPSPRARTAPPSAQLARMRSATGSSGSPKVPPMRRRSPSTTQSAPAQPLTARTSGREHVVRGLLERRRRRQHVRDLDLQREPGLRPPAVGDVLADAGRAEDRPVLVAHDRVAPGDDALRSVADEHGLAVGLAVAGEQPPDEVAHRVRAALGLEGGEEVAPDELLPREAGDLREVAVAVRDATLDVERHRDDLGGLEQREDRVRVPSLVHGCAAHPRMLPRDPDGDHRQGPSGAPHAGLAPPSRVGRFRRRCLV